MKIQEIRVNRYGPLSNIVYEKPTPFTLIYGKNESGKTLLLDAVLRFCLTGKRNRSLFHALDRVEHDPDGYVDISRGETTFRFPDEGSLPDELDIHPTDLKNVLVVRASDLQFPEGEEAEYYASLTDRLMGIHRETILSIRDELQDIGRLTNNTSDAGLSDRQGYRKIASKIDNAKSLLNDIGQLMGDEEKEGPTELENKLFEKEETIEDLRHNLNEQQQAGKREEYQTSKELIDDLKHNQEQLEELPDVEQDQFDRWREFEKTIDTSETEIEEQNHEIDEYKSELDSTRSKHEEVEQELDSFQRKGEVVDELKQATERQTRRFKRRKGFSVLRTVFKLGFITFGILLGLSIIGLIFQPKSTLLWIFAILSGLSFIVDGILFLLVYIQKARTESGWEDLRLKAEKYGFEVESFEGLLESVEGLKEDIDKTRDSVQEFREEIKGLETRIDERDKRIEELRGKISKAEEGIQELIEQTGVSTLDELAKVLGERKELDEDSKKLITHLEVQYDKSELPLGERMAHWENEISKLEKFSDAAHGVEYKPQKVDELTDEIENLEEEIAEIEEELREYRTQFEAIGKDANRILAPEESFPGETMEDMNYIRGKLKDFITNVESLKDNAIMAISIFEQIEAEEEEKVKDLFGEDDLASKYFREITNGAYESVEYNPEKGTLLVKKPDGVALEAWQLSTGTYDQLYFSTRLSLAHQILGGEKGFLLLDDPFLAADSTRLANQLDMLVDQVKDGWQIFYFSVKDEVADYLRSEHKGEEFDYIELQEIY